MPKYSNESLGIKEESPVRDFLIDAGLWVATAAATQGMGATVTTPAMLAKWGPKALKAYQFFKANPLLAGVAKTAFVDTPLIQIEKAGINKMQGGEFNPMQDMGENIMFNAGMDFAGRGLISPAWKAYKKTGGLGGEFRDELWEGISSKVADTQILPNRVASLPFFSGRKTIGEIFTPAVERLDKQGLKSPAGTPVADVMRSVSRNEAVANHQGRLVAHELAEMSLEERHATLMFLRKGIVDVDKKVKGASDNFLTLPAESQAKVSKALRQADEYLKLSSGGSSTPYYDKMRAMGFKKEVGNFFTNLEGTSNGGKYMNLIRETIGEERFDPKATSRVLGQVMEDTSLSEETRAYARSLYLLQENTPEGVSMAAAKAEKSILFNWMKGVASTELREKLPPSLLSTKPIPGWVKSSVKGIKDSYVPKDVELALNDMEYVPKLANSLYNRLFLSPWKLGKVVFSVPTHFRNTFSNIIQNDWGGLPFYRADIYMKALKDMRQGTVPKSLREFTKHTGINTTMVGEEFTFFPRVLPPGGTAFDMAITRLENMAGKVTRGPARAYQWEETLSKYAKYLHNLEKGMDSKEAAKDAVKWTFNYGEVTPIVKAARVSVMPFATWTAKILPLLAETAIKHPIRLSKWAMLPSALTWASLKNQGITDEEWDGIQQTLPEYLQNKGPIPAVALLPTRDEKGRLQLLNFTWMLPGIGDVAELGGSNMFEKTLQNPLVSIAADIGRNTTYSGAPIYHPWESPWEKTGKVLTHGWMQLTPNVLGNDWVTLRRMYDYKDPDAPTLGQFTSGYLGAKIIPLDKDKQVYKDYNRRRSMQSEAASERQRRYMGTTDPERQKKAIDEYQEDIRKIWEKPKISHSFVWDIANRLGKRY